MIRHHEPESDTAVNPKPTAQVGLQLHDVSRAMDRKSARKMPGTRSPFERDRRQPFRLAIHNGELAQLQQWVLRHESIETGGDLFGLWSTDSTAVVHLVLGPGKLSRRTTTSFYQDAEYLGEAGNRLTKEYGLCHIGEWHSHHTLGLAYPSGGDQSTVWRHMPSNGFMRFIVCIANIDSVQHSRTYNERHIPVGLGCFLFEAKDTQTWERYNMLQGSFDVIEGQSPYREMRVLSQSIALDAESINSASLVKVQEQWSVSRADVGKKGTSILLFQKSTGTALNYDHRASDRSSRDLYDRPSSRTTARYSKPASIGRQQTTTTTTTTSGTSILGTPTTNSKRADRQRMPPAVMPTTRRVTEATPVWERLSDSYQLVLKKLSYQLTGELIKELACVTINFKVTVPSRYDLACRLVYHEDQKGQLRLYTSGLAIEYTPIKLDTTSMHFVETTATTVKGDVERLIQLVIKMAVTDSTISGSARNQERQYHRRSGVSVQDARTYRPTSTPHERRSGPASKWTSRGRRSPVLGKSGTSSRIYREHMSRAGLM